MDKFKAVATCAFGLESVLAFELRRLGIEGVAASDGRVAFLASPRDIVRANLWLRTAERVMIVVGEYECSDFDALFDGARALPWEAYITSLDAFPVKGYSMNSRLTSVPACQAVIKKAVVDRLLSAHRVSALPETGPAIRVRFAIVKDRCTMMLDTSGDGLHKRGYRPLTTEAPIKETLAAGIVDFARVREDSLLADPFCGSGTLVIEAAQRAKNIAPGLNRAFAYSELSFIDEALDREERESARAAVRASSFVGRGIDIDPQAVAAAQRNARAAGVSDCTSFAVGDAREYPFEGGEIVLANPPYGERILDERELEGLYAAFCKNLKARGYGSMYMITNYPLLERDMGAPASRRRKLYNGMLPCQLYMYF